MPSTINSVETFKPITSSPWQTVNTSSITLKERFDHQSLELIVKNLKDDYIQRMLTKSTLEDEKQEKIKAMSTLLRSYLKHSKDGEISITYRQKGSEKRTGGKMGRFYVDDKTYGLQPMTKYVRHTIGKNHYFDLDIVNCHPTILLQYCQKLGYETPILEQYVNTREKIIEESKMPRENFKIEFLAILNGREYNGMNDFLIKWYQEARSILETVAKIHKGKIYPSKKDYNENGSITNKFICGEENTILFHVFNYLWENEYEPGVLCFDGIMVRKNSKKLREDSTENEFKELFRGLGAFVQKYTGYTINFSRKEMDHCLDFSQVRDTKTTSTGDILELLPSLDKSVQELLEAVEDGQLGMAKLYRELFAKDYVKFIGEKQGFYWDEEKLLWVKVSTPDSLSNSVLTILNEHFRTQIDLVKKLTEEEKDTGKINAGKKLIKTLETSKRKLMTGSTGREIAKLIAQQCVDVEFGKNMNSSVYFLPINNGKKVDLRTGEILPRTCLDLFSSALTVEVSEDEEKYTEFLEYIRSLMGCSEENMEILQHEGRTHNTEEEMENLQILMGYCASGDSSQKILTMFYGPLGNNGKSTFCNLIKDVLGSFAITVDKNLISAKGAKNANAQGPNPAMMALEKAHIGIVNEVDEDFAFNVALVKQLSGDDGITSRTCHQEVQGEFRSKIKLIITGNCLPEFKGEGDAIKNRMNVVPFLNKFELTQENIEYGNKIKTLRNECFRWVIEGSNKFFKTMKLPKSATTQAVIKEYKDDNDSLQQFIEEYCEKQSTIHKGNFYYKVSDFVKDLNRRMLASFKPKHLKPRMAEKKFMVVQYHGFPMFKGLRPKKDIPFPEQEVNPLLE